MVRSEGRVAVDIIVPIYNARDKLTLCVDSVVRHARGEYRLILVNDASPDPAMRPYLDALAAAHPFIVVIHAPVNGGFVKSVNLGLTAAQGRDVLLLNSDTIVTPGFLERLWNCVYADAVTGIATPFSNNATICSLPNFCEDNPVPLLEELDEYAACLSDHSLHQRPEIVTGVGFAMYIRAAVLAQTGPLDEAFGKGFGEENDLCERAKAAGFKVRLCDDVFIAHLGKASFGQQGFDFEQQNAKILKSRWPNYFRDVADFCRLDPVRQARENALYHLRRRHHMNRAAMLQVVHFDPFRPDAGGTEFYVLDIVRELRLPRTLIAWRTPDAVMAAEILDGNLSEPVLHRYPVNSPWHHHVYEDRAILDIFARLLDDFGVRTAHLHHLFGWPIDLWRPLLERAIPYHYTVHDYYCVCTNQNMLDFERWQPCSCEPGTAQAEHCQAAYVKTQRRDHDQLRPLPYHRAAFEPLLAQAQSILPPSTRAGELVREAYSHLRLPVEVLPHGRYPDRNLVTLPAPSSEAFRIGFLGCINHPSKGSAIYLEILRSLADRPYEWHFFGDLEEFQFRRQIEDLKLKGKAIFHGFYRREEIVAKLQAAHIDCVLLTPPWDETFSYTLSEALCAGVPVLAQRRGALTERLEAAGLSECLFDTWEQVAQALRERPPQLPEWQRLARAFRHRPVSEVAGRLRALYGSVADAPCELTAAQQAATFTAHFNYSQVNRPWEFTDALRISPIIDVERHYPAFWFSTYATLRPTLPRPLRDVVRNRILNKKSEWLRAYTAADLSASWYPAEGMQVVADGAAVRIVAETGDPYIVLPEHITQADRIDFLRIRLRMEEPTPANLQLYWINEAGEGFSEERSLSLSLAQTTAWQDYVIDLRRAWQWNALPGHGGIRHLRLDPLDHSGTVWLDSLSVGKFKDWQLQLLTTSAARS